MRGLRVLRFFSLILLTVSFVTPLTLAQPPGGSNFVSGTYPEMPCEKPEEPRAAENTKLEIDFYHEEIDDFNLKVKAYNECVKGYYSNSYNDIERIKKAANDVIMIVVKNQADKKTFSGGSNLVGKNIYPEMKCDRPEKPKEPISPDIYSKRVYERKLAKYDLDYEIFMQCADTYRENAKEDLERVREVSVVEPVFLVPIKHICNKRISPE